MSLEQTMQRSSALVADLEAVCEDLVEMDPAGSEAEAIELLAVLERSKSALSAVQAKHTAVLEQYRLNKQAAAGVPKDRWGTGLASEVGLARGDSPARGKRHLVSRAFNSLPVCFSMEYDESWTGISRIETISR